jgi:hypothetical protein
MPSASTTKTALEAAFAVQFLAIVPTIADERAGGWVHGDQRRELPPSMTPRRYTIQFGPDQPVIGGATGNGDAEVACIMRVVTDYRMVREERLSDVVAADGFDLHDRLADRLDPLIPGLMWIQAAQPSYAVDDAEAQVVAHLYEIQYLRARPSTV